MDVQAALRIQAKRKEFDDYKCVVQNPLTVGLANEAFRNQTLTVVLGAGASAALKLPQWNALVEGLLLDLYDQITPGGDHSFIGTLLTTYSAAVLVRHAEVLAGFPQIAREALRERLYATFDESAVPALIEPLSALMLAGSLATPVRHVITYNFDNALERYLSRTKLQEFISVFSGATYPVQKAGLKIFHPHGFLPHMEDDPTGEKLTEPVVFSEMDYNLHYMDPAHWANVVQLHHFMNRSCLFIGVSFTDPNMRRLLDHARERTGRVIRHISIQRDRGDRMLNSFLERDLHSLGVATLWVSDFSEIPDALLAITR